MLNSYLELNFDVFKAASGNKYADGDVIMLVILVPISLFSNHKITGSSGKHLEYFDHSQNVSLIYKLLTSSKDSDDLSIGFDRDRNRRQRNLTNNKYI